MADTRQLVSWAIERACPFRSGDDWFLPNRTSEQLGDLRTVASAEAGRRIVNGICVTGFTYGSDHAKKAYEIPSSGFRMHDRLSKFGGLLAAQSTCGACEANARTGLGLEVAGCFGWLDICPDSSQFDQKLWDTIERRSLEERLRATFLVTTPLSYGFWINSPLRRAQAEFLHEVLVAVCETDNSRDKKLRHFICALRAAIRWELPIHVSLSPIAHSDMGWHTVFPHCPRCKAQARVGRWKEHYTSGPYECQVCGHTFNPDEHHSRARWKFDFACDNLERQLGKTAFDEFTRAYLVQRGCPTTRADEVIENKNYFPLLLRIREVGLQRSATIVKLRQSAKQSEQAPAATFRGEIADDVYLEFVLVPAGEFQMGSAGPDAHPAETPQHVVRLPRPFYMARFPVTQAQWIAVMGNNPSIYRGDERLPVHGVSWLNCQEFCERLCKRFGCVIRLPSEAEWEYACRAGTRTNYAFGDSLSPAQANFTPAFELGALATYEKTSARQDELSKETRLHVDPPNAKPTPVGSYPPNAWGLYDMHGNVDEWCEDVWHPNYEGAPVQGGPWIFGEGRVPFRVVRGGWASGTEFVCTSASRRQLRADAGSARDTGAEDEQDKDVADDWLQLLIGIPPGFRVACEIPRETQR